MNWIESTRDCGGPVVLVPCGFIRPYSHEEAAVGRQWDGDEGPEGPLYLEICEESSSLLRIIRGKLPEGYCFSGVEANILRLYSEGGPVYWLPRPYGVLAVGWCAADSAEELQALALQHEHRQNWDEEIQYEAKGDAFYLGESTIALFTQPEDCCRVLLPSGNYSVKAAYTVDSDEASGVVFKFCRQ